MQNSSTNMSANMLSPPSTPAHLSEFVDILNNNKLRKSTSSVFHENINSNILQTPPPPSLHLPSGGHISGINGNNTTAPSYGNRNFSFSTTQQRRPSTYAPSMTSSFYQFNNIVSKKDIENTCKDIKLLQKQFGIFAKQLDDITKTTSSIGMILESISNNSKSEDDEMLLQFTQCSGFFHMLGTHQQVLSQTLREQFLKPLDKHMNQIITKFNEHEKVFKNDYKLNYTNLQKQEKLVMNQKKNHKNLINYREQIYELENKLSIIENLKIDYYNGSAVLLNEHSQYVLKLIASVISIQLDLSEDLAKKGWNGGGLEFVYKLNNDFDEEEEDAEGEGEEEEYNSSTEAFKRKITPQSELGANTSNTVITKQPLISSSAGKQEENAANTTAVSTASSTVNTSTTSNDSTESRNSSFSRRSLGIGSVSYNNTVIKNIGSENTSNVAVTKNVLPDKLLDRQVLDLKDKQQLDEADTSFSLPYLEEDITDQSSI